MKLKIEGVQLEKVVAWLYFNETTHFFNQENDIKVKFVCVYATP